MSDAVDFSGKPQPYRYSGKLGRSLLLLPLLCLLAALVTSMIYAQVAAWVPFMKLKIALSVVTGMGLGWVVAWLAQRLRCRSPLYLALAGMLTAAAGTHVIMASFVDGILSSGGASPGLGALLFDPEATWNFLVQISQSGIFQKRGRVMSPTDLWVDWGFEMVPYILAVPITAWFAYKKQIFCEECLKWLDLKKENFMFALPSDENEMELYARGDLRLFSDKPLISGAYTSFIRVDYVVCPSCGNTGTYRIVKVEGPEEEKNLSSLMLLTPDNVPVLGQLLAKREASSSDAPVADPDTRSGDAAEAQR